MFSTCIARLPEASARVLNPAELQQGRDYRDQRQAAGGLVTPIVIVHRLMFRGTYMSVLDMIFRCKWPVGR